MRRRRDGQRHHHRTLGLRRAESPDSDVGRVPHGLIDVGADDVQEHCELGEHTHREKRAVTSFGHQQRLPPREGDYINRAVEVDGAAGLLDHLHHRRLGIDHRVGEALGEDELDHLPVVEVLAGGLSGLAADGNAAPGLELLVDRLKTFRTNDEFLAEIADTATVAEAAALAARRTRQT